MTDLYDEPEAVEDLLEICTAQAIRFAIEQIWAGADFIGIGDAAVSLIGPKAYMQFAMPYEKRIIEAIHQHGGKAKLHICGNITSILEFVAQTGADMVDVDSMVDFKSANEAFTGKCCACGNIDPVSVMLQGNTDQVRNTVLACVSAGNNHTFIAAGCEIPKMTPYENMDAFNNALSSLG